MGDDVEPEAEVPGGQAPGLGDPEVVAVEADARPQAQVLPGWLRLLDEQLDRVRLSAHRQQAVQDPAPAGMVQPPGDEGDVGVRAGVEQPSGPDRAVTAGVTGAEARGRD